MLLLGLHYSRAALSFKSMANPPTPFDIDKANKIIEMLSEGESQKTISNTIGVPWRTVANWCTRYEDFGNLVDSARELGHDALADKILAAHTEIDDPFKARLFSENARWVLARRAAAKYGDRLEVHSTSTVNISKALEDAKSRIIDITPKHGRGLVSVNETNQLISDPGASLIGEFELDYERVARIHKDKQAAETNDDLARLELLK